MSKIGVNWAIVADGNPQERAEYVEGNKAKTPQEAEERWRTLRKLHFIGVTVRRTTLFEDKLLVAGLQEGKKARGSK